MAMMRRAGHVADMLGCALALADIRLAQGRLHEAMRTCEGALQLSAGLGAPGVRGTADMHVEMSVIYRERNDLGAASQQLVRSRELGELAGAPQNPYRRCAAMAHLHQAHGDLDGALDLLAEAERLYVGDFFPNERPIAARKARVWLRQGRLGEALAWVRERGLSTRDDLSYLREFEHITLVRVLLACHRGDPAGGMLGQAMGLLERLLEAAEAGERARSTIEILLLQALCLEMQGDSGAALMALRRALALAEPEGYVRLFVDEGLPMAHLLREVAARGPAAGYAGRLLAALGESHGVRTEPVMAAPLVEPLSERELDVLRWLGSGLSGPEIAQQLVVSLNTLRTHTKNIYDKLAVNSRRAAVSRAQELGLL
jgi:LuxR family maltose regulon positive regulatory protein